MVSIVGQESPSDLIGKIVGQGIQQNLPRGLEQTRNRNMLQNSLDEISKISQNPNASPLDLTLATMKAGAGIPGSERYMATILPEILRLAEVKRSQNSTLAGEGNGGQSDQFQNRDRSPVDPMAQRESAPNFLDKPGQENRFFPTNKGPGEGLGHTPQEATTGKKLPLLPPNELPAAAKKLAQENTAAGNPMSVPQAAEQLKQYEQEKIAHNARVDEELEQQVQAQKNYGQKAVNELNKVYTKDGVDEKGNKIKVPAATPEMQAVFKKYGEEISKEGKSEAEIDRALANKARVFSNTISNVKNDLSAPRLINSIGRAMEGTYKNFEDSSKDLRSKLKPLLDMGLYDTSRELMSELGYYPEEIDMTVNPLGEREKTALNRVPRNKMITSKYNSFIAPSPSTDLENIKQGLRDLKEANPNFSLVLARKAFEDKDYDSRMFKNALNELEEQEGFKLEDDQEQQKGILDTPPLSLLQSIMHSFNVVGR